MRPYSRTVAGSVDEESVRDGVDDVFAEARNAKAKIRSDAEAFPAPTHYTPLHAARPPALSLPHTTTRTLATAAAASSSQAWSPPLQPPPRRGDMHPELRRWVLPDSMISGAGAGLVSSVVTCPLDVIKTKLQAQQHAHGSAGYQGALGTVKTVLRQDGLKGLYRGLGPTLLGYLPTWAIYFTVYDGVKRRAEDQMNKPGRGHRPIPGAWALHIWAAMTAGATGTIITNPLWVIKTRFMTQSATEPRYRNTLHAFWTIYRQEGIRAFYSGLVPSLLGVAHVAVQFPLYEQFKTWQASKVGEPLPASRLLLCSALSKAIASMATYPHEVVRTRLQVQRRVPKRAGAGGVPVEPGYKGVIHTLTKIVRDEGYKGLYKGFIINLCRTVPNSIVTLLSYELLMRSLASYHTSR